MRFGDVKISVLDGGIVSIRREYEDEVTEITVDRNGAKWYVNGAERDF